MKFNKLDTLRTSGVATLAGALLLACGWVRSVTVQDIVLLPSYEVSKGVMSTVEISSGLQEVGWVSTEAQTEFFKPISNVEWNVSSVLPTDTSMAWWDRPELLVADFRLCGFRYVSAKYIAGTLGCHLHGKAFVVPFWALVIPPTLMSAWLLLCAPHRRRRAGSIAVGGQDQWGHSAPAEAGGR